MNKYSQYSPDELNELFSNYLIDSWSYSKVSTFARNEMAFCMLHVYLEKEQRSISSIAGNAYHDALRCFFEHFHREEMTAIVDISKVAYDYIENVPANDWRLTDKFPTVDTAAAEAIRIVNALLENFYAEKEIYLDEIHSILSVEVKENAWTTVNGVDIPLPLHFIADLVVETNDGKTVIIDHKSKSSYTSEEEVALKHGKQGITYVLGYEANHDAIVDEVWFIENKYSKNKDKGPQLRKHVIVMDKDSRAFYEMKLYVPLKRMLEAVSDPDYCYTTNDADNLCDQAALESFETKTYISEVDDFINVPESKKDLIAKRQRKIKDSSTAMISPTVITAFRKTAASFITYDYSNSNMTNSEKIEHSFLSFGKQVKVAHEISGYSCDTYLCDAAVGVQMNQLKAYAMNIAHALDVASVRFSSDLVMYEGKSYLGIEVTKTKRDKVLSWDPSFQTEKNIPLGLDNFGQPIVWNLANQSTPHMLVCGASGSGKSVSLISSIMYAKQAGIDDIVILDPKYEYCDYASDSIRVINDITDIEVALEGMVAEMNRRIKSREKKLTLVIFDEFADAQDQSKEYHKRNKDAETMPMEVSFKMLLQKGRSCGYRFIAATQRADTKTISGTTRSNFAVLCCFRMPKAADSRVVLDEEGANMLFGQGDGLIKSPQYMDQTIRFQGFYYQQ